MNVHPAHVFFCLFLPVMAALSLLAGLRLRHHAMFSGLIRSLMAAGMPWDTPGPGTPGPDLPRRGDPNPNRDGPADITTGDAEGMLGPQVGHGVRPPQGIYADGYLRPGHRNGDGGQGGMKLPFGWPDYNR